MRSEHPVGILTRWPDWNPSGRHRYLQITSEKFEYIYSLPHEYETVALCSENSCSLGGSAHHVLYVRRSRMPKGSMPSYGV